MTTATRRDDLSRTLANVPDAACCVLLAHSPAIVLPVGADARRVGLILAGYTHGGQIRLPRVGALLTESAVPRRLAMGLHVVRGMPLVVSRGVDYSGLDLRIGCPPEVALFTLRCPVRASRAEGSLPRLDWMLPRSGETAHGRVTDREGLARA